MKPSLNAKGGANFRRHPTIIANLAANTRIRQEWSKRCKGTEGSKSARIRIISHASEIAGSLRPSGDRDLGHEGSERAYDERVLTWRPACGRGWTRSVPTPVRKISFAVLATIVY